MALNMNKLTEKAHEALVSAQSLAQEMSHSAIESEHLLTALLEQGEGVAPQIVSSIGANPESLAQQARQELGKLPRVYGPAQVGLSQRLARTLDNAQNIASNLKDEFVSTEHFLTALAEADGAAGRILNQAGVTRDRILQALTSIRGNQRVTSQNPETTYQALQKYGRDLTDLARKGKLDPVIGRDEEIRRVMQILSRRTKNNPVLIGDPGVGKTGIVEGLAQRIVRGDVPEPVKNKRVIALDFGQMVAGAKYRGEFEERLKAVLKEITTAAGQIIVFIDEIHTVVGAGAAEGAMDASNMLKPMLARGELHAIGATTLDEYRKHVEKDAALERRFQPVLVEEPGVEDTISILRGLRERYEMHHGVRIRDTALVAAAVLSKRYISDRFLPDKAIDLVDEAASRLRLEIDSMPADLDEIQRRIAQLEIERVALQKEKDPGSRERLQSLEKELADLKEESAAVTSKWKQEKEVVDDVRRLKEEKDQAQIELERAERQADYNKAAEIRYGRMAEIDRKLAAAQNRLNELQKAGALLKEEVTEDDIASVVSKWTGIPVSRLMEGEAQKLIQMEERLHRRVVGQDEAITVVANAVRRARAGLKDPNRPVGSFIFLGPTGVGKTELARALAEFLFDDEQAMIRIDMSEYQEKHTVARLIGAPPGYVGYEEGGQLTEAVRRKPYSVVLFDEIEKAHPDVFNVMLQILDDGRLTDGQGRVVDFKNVVVIMTSNIGTEFLSGLAGNRLEGGEWEGVKDRVIEAMRAHFRPEFLNRIDDVVVFHSLTLDDLKQIVEIQLRQVSQRLSDRKITIELTGPAKELIVQEGYDPTFGARPLKRTIQRRVLDPLALQVLNGRFHEGDHIVVDAENGDLVFLREEGQPPAGSKDGKKQPSHSKIVA